MQSWHELADVVGQDEWEDAGRPKRRCIEFGGQNAFDDASEGPEGFFFVCKDEKKCRCDEVHALAVANVRVPSADDFVSDYTTGEW